ncbi:MAG: hypothetical protein ABJA02_01395 [Acidobacteriota bacterium]
MKNCPQCGSRYTDDTLLFCLQDGTPLAGADEFSEPTVRISEVETVARHAGKTQVPLNGERSAYGPDSQMTHVAAAKRGTNLLAAGGIIGAVVLILLIALAVGGVWLYSRKERATRSNTADNGNRVTNAIASNLSGISTPTASPSAPKPTTTASASPVIVSPPPSPPSPDNGQARSEAMRKVFDWKSTLEARDFNAYMSNYADTVDYYRKPAVNIGSIRADKARAFQMYDNMRVDISNEVATSSLDGNRATVTFDKEWHFSGRSRSDGKTRSQLDLTRINGRWLITGERDLQVYYKR